MQSIDLIRQNLKTSAERTLLRIDDMREHAMVAPTPNGGGHTLWVLGHLAYVEGLITRSIMLGEPNPREAWKEIFDGADVSYEADEFPAFDEALEACRQSRQETLELLATLSEEDLDRKSQRFPEGLENTFGTYRHCFQLVADHWYMHRGQLAGARRAAGLDRMWF